MVLIGRAACIMFDTAAHSCLLQKLYFLRLLVSVRSYCAPAALHDHMFAPACPVCVAFDLHLASCMCVSY